MSYLFSISNFDQMVRNDIQFKVSNPITKNQNPI